MNIFYLAFMMPPKPRPKPILPTESSESGIDRPKRNAKQTSKYDPYEMKAPKKMKKKGNVGTNTMPLDKNNVDNGADLEDIKNYLSQVLQNSSKYFIQFNL